MAAVRYTIEEMQKDVFHRQHWMRLIPLLQIVNGAIMFAERGLNYDQVIWWGVQHIKATIDLHRRGYPST